MNDTIDDHNGPGSTYDPRIDYDKIISDLNKEESLVNKVERLEGELEVALYEIKNQEAELRDWVRSLAREAALEAEVESLKEQLWVSRMSSKLLQDSTPAS